MSLLVVSACARPTTTPAPRPIVPVEGPRVSIYTSVTGGVLSRRVDAVIRTDESAYVLVGHLAANGDIDIIYPATPLEAKRLRGPQLIRTKLFDASTDVDYALFNRSRLIYRPMAAKYDSYDGSGQGYVFVIASRTPMNYGAFSAGRQWDKLSVDNYDGTNDPRLGVRDFADELAAGGSYSISYARAWTTNYNQYASAFDCAMLSTFAGFGSNPLYGTWSPFSYLGSSLVGAWLSRSFGLPCENSLQYASIIPRYSYPQQLAFTPQLNPSNPRTAPDPKTTRAWAPKTKYNPRAATAAFRNRPTYNDPFRDIDYKARLGSSGSGSGSWSNTANNSGSASSAVSAPAPAKDASGNSGPKTKQ
jgi:hypothetical protein